MTPQERMTIKSIKNIERVFNTKIEVLDKDNAPFGSGYIQPTYLHYLQQVFKALCFSLPRGTFSDPELDLQYNTWDLISRYSIVALHKEI
jgi:hypothetical protein